jgi:ankyrin repeat protein
MNKLQDIFEKCQNTGSWFGLKVSSVTDKNDFEDTPLHTVCSWGELQSAKVLLDAGADVNAKGDQGATPIFNAIVSGNVELVQLLLKRGASKKHKIFGNTSVQDYAKNLGVGEDILELLK